MKASIWYWTAWALVGYALRFVPICRSSEVAILLVAYVIMQGMKRVVFRSCPFSVRYPDKDHVVVVTGASAGIGSATASELCARGGKVIWAARDTAKAWRKLNDIPWTLHHGKRGYVLKLDLASKQKIEEFVEEFKKREKRLDCIILNAAYWGPRRTTADGFEETIGVNHLGHMYLVYLLLDMIKASPDGRIVVVGSDIHKLQKAVKFDDLMYSRDYSAWGAYAHSKLCTMLFGRELANRLKGTRVTVYIAHPGTPVPSELMRNSWAWWTLFQFFVLQPVFHLFCRTTAQGAQTSVYCACAEKCAAAETGQYYENVRPDKPAKAALDDEAAFKLWNVSCELLAIPEHWA